MSKKRTVSIKYTSREFDTIKADLVEYIKRYYPNSYKDFNEASFGSLMIDTVSYVGDILSFYIDYQANETYLSTATEFDNLLKIGKQAGYKFSGTPSSVGLASFYVMVPATTSGIGPDTKYIPVLKKGASVSTKSGNSFILSHDVHFGSNNNEIRVARVDPNSGDPTYYVIKAFGEVVSGVIDTEFVTVGSFEKFKKVRLESLDISEVISVKDAEGNEYYEVDFLSQNIIYKGVTNRSKTLGNQSLDYNTGDQSSEILKPVVVPRRFVTDRSRRRTELTFGASSDYIMPNDMISEPQSTVLEVHGRNYIQDTSFDPTNLIKSDKFGISPSDTILTVEYRRNSAQNVNCSTNQLTQTGDYEMEFTDITTLNSAQMTFISTSLEVDNEEPIIGDVTIPNSEELRHRIMGTFPTQNRAVTQQDYESLIYQMPPRFGAVKRCRVIRDNDSLKRNINIYMISENASGTLTEANSVLKRNVRTWIQKNKMINDTVDILNAKVVNLTIDFVAVASIESSKYDVLAAAKTALARRFTRHPDIGEPFFITDVYKELRKVDGIIDVSDVKINQKNGMTSEGNYSTIRFDINRAMSADGRYIELPKNLIYELKYPILDINGVIV